MIIDAHHHVGPLHAGIMQFDAEWRSTDQVARRNYLAENGIDRCLIFPANSYTTARGADTHTQVNTFLARYRDEAQDIVHGICGTVNPRDGEVACREIERCFDVLGCCGIVFHHRFLGSAIDDAAMDPLLQTIQRYGKPVFIHIIADSKLESPWRLFRLAKRYPAIRFVGLDGFSGPDQAAFLRTVAADYPNVWFDTGVMISVAHGLREFIGTHGSARIVFGTDFYSGTPLFYHPFPLHELRRMDISDHDRNNIYAVNLLQLLESRP